MANKALLIGINYLDTNNQLQGCANDVRAIRDLLQKNNYKDIRVLSDDINESNIIEPTAENILAEFNKLIDNAKSGDVLFFHYSGHGTQTYDQGSDETDGKDEAIYPVDGKLITDDTFKQAINRIPAGVKLFLLMDCCNSGSNLDLKYNTLQRSLKAAMQGYAVEISGCLDNQTSADAFINGKYNGALTACFIDQSRIKGFKNLFDNNLFSGSRTKLKALTSTFSTWMKTNGFSQRPNIAYEGVLTAGVTTFISAPILTKFSASRNKVLHTEVAGNLRGYNIGGYHLRQTPSREGKYEKDKEAVRQLLRLG